MLSLYSTACAASGPAALSAGADTSEEQKTLSAEVLWQMQRIGAPVISPDGRWIVAPVTRYTVEDDKSHTDLWLFASDGTVERPLTRHGSADGQPVFRPDGSQLAFVSRRDDDKASQIYILPIDQPGEAVRLTNVPTGVSAPKWVGDHIYFISRVWPDKCWSGMRRELESRSKSHVSARIWNELPFSHWDHWLDEEREAHIFRIPAPDNRPRPAIGKAQAAAVQSDDGDAQKAAAVQSDDEDAQKAAAGQSGDGVTRDATTAGTDAGADDTVAEAGHVCSSTIEAVTLPTGRQLPRSTQGTSTYDVAPDESLVAFVSDTNHDDTNPKMDIYLVVPGSEEARNITEENEAWDGNPQFSPDGTLLAFNRQRIKGFYADTRRLMLHDLGSGISRDMTAHWDRSADGLVWLPDGSGFFGSIDDAGTRRVYHISAETGQVRPITGTTNYTSLTLSGNGILAGINQSFHYPPRLVVIDPAEGSAQRLDTINDDVLDGVVLGTYESVTYEGYGGQEIQMWVHYPPGFDPSKEYPLFLLIHGGPHSGITDGFHFRWNAQTFASWGYVTAWHNFHGSSGFGQEFTDAINPDWTTKPYADTRKAAEWFAAKPWIDAERMVAGGGSYGGYLSSILLGREHPFKTLLIHAPVYNMYSQLAADFAVHTTRFGNYWEHDIYKEISPHYFAGDFHTPALIIHGQLDYRVPVGQAFELFRTLQHLGIESRLIYYPDENHWILKPNNSLKWYEEVRDWIGRFAEPGPR